MNEVLDLLIIGGGPTGINCAIAAKAANLQFLVIEKGLIANSIYQFPTNMTFFSTSKKLEIGEIPFISHADKPTRREALEYYRRLVEAYQLPVAVYTQVEKMEPVSTTDTPQYLVRTNRGDYRAKTIIVATGFYDRPRMMDIPGEDLPKVRHYYDDAHPYIGQKVLVIGARNSACDVALETHAKGADVTMAIRGDKIYERVKYWIKPNIENRIKEGSIKAYFQTTVETIKPRSVVLQTPEGLQEIENDFVLAMTGYTPNYELLHALQLPIDQSGFKVPIHREETLETPLPGVYVAGVLNAGLKTSALFIENTRHHGHLIVDHIQANYLSAIPNLS
ncbi:MAG: YpdA family putative bacillithiol disulfide reductase [Bacteroidota bacterium]